MLLKKAARLNFQMACLQEVKAHINDQDLELHVATKH